MDDALETLLAAAVLAPSGDNTQPWRFSVDSDLGQITCFLDPNRDPSPMNAGQRMARIAMGAAVENMLRTARENNWHAVWEDAVPPAVGRIRLQEKTGRAGVIHAALRNRATNRRFYDAKPVDAAVLERVQRETPVLEGVKTCWIVDKGRLAALASLIGRADAIMFGEPTMRQAFLSKVRFDAAAEAMTPEGLSLASLELSTMDRYALRMMPRLPNWLLHWGGALRSFASRARQLTTSAAGACLVIASDSQDQTDLLVGRAMERAWLTLTDEGLAVQPMMSLLVLDNVLTHGGQPTAAALPRRQVETLLHEWRDWSAGLGAGRPAFLMRFGCAPPPSGRTGRLPLTDALRRGDVNDSKR